MSVIWLEGENWVPTEKQGPSSNVPEKLYPQKGYIKYTLPWAEVKLKTLIITGDSPQLHTCNMYKVDVILTTHEYTM